ncbi:uncharacterized protein LOC128893663 isoform X2 [Hylaeus anthracinus]|uniref:uncharacterized protein LOC128879169 isoform X2 n=1 Tax=Hylaeus volcanicus TaxID=313075 RepID=UPI0023B7ED39|nr:uncharacterized protein LOC128879169 isoform X2 [Hylaeus volcanicus]XP_054010775.1 uncharacterized protein LOC128893663 isoform X2 [Hylaeus anthracinus]
MDVPLFPAPPSLKGASSPLSDVVDITRLTRVSLPTVGCPSKRHVPKSRRTSGIHRIQRCARKNLVCPNSRDQIHQRVTEFRITMTERERHNEEDDDDVVCAIESTTPVSEDIPTRLETVVEPKKLTKSIAIQTIVGLPLRLRFLPSVKDIFEENGSGKKSTKIWKHIRFLGRLSLSLFGLSWLLTIWAVVGAFAFCATEGPREREQVVKLKYMQKNLAVGLATELRQLRTEQNEDVEPLWSNKVQQYVAKHEEVLLMAVSAGYGESGNAGQLWTFPGCILFSISLLTTLGFGAPVPRTTAGRTVTKYAISRNTTGYDKTEAHLVPMPKWLKVVPFVWGGSYYLLGILCFGVARSRPIAASVLFPLDFTAAGGLSTIVGYVRILYGFYLEGAVAIAAIALAVLRVSTTQTWTGIGLKYNLLVEA